MTGPAYGQQTIWGTGVETTYGTPPAGTVDRWYEILPAESVERRNRLLVSQGMRGGSYNLRRGSRRVISGRDAHGDVTLEVATTGLGRLLNQMMGGTVPTPVQQGVTTAYKQTHPLASIAGKSMTLQKQIRDSAGSAIQTLTQKGAKVAGFELSCAVDEILKLKLTMDGQDEVDDVAAAAASYTSAKLFNFSQATVFTLNGTPAANVLSFTTALDRKLKEDRYFLGHGGLKSESAENDFPDISGQFRAEVVDSTFYDLFKTDAAAAMVLSFVGDTIAGAYHETLTITIPEIHLGGETPKVGSAGILEQNVPYTAAADAGGDVGMTLELTSTDVAV
jgi:hypothetical protein